jgi:hypothetical protein
LEDILTDLAVELAATAVISIFAACVSFGVGAAAGTAKAAHTITKFAATIRSAVGAWKIAERISEGVKKAHDIAGIRKRLERIKSLARKGKPPEGSLPGARWAIPEGAPKAITGYTKHAEDQIAGRDRGIGVSREALEDAFQSPVRDVGKIVDEQGRVSYLYTGENATVAINPDGRVITGWATSSSGTGAAGG